MTPEAFLALKKKAETARREADRLAGQLEAGLARLREEFGVTDEKAAKKLLEQLDRELAAAEAEAERRLWVFEQQYGGRLAE